MSIRNNANNVEMYAWINFPGPYSRGQFCQGQFSWVRGSNYQIWCGQRCIEVPEQFVL